MRRRSLIRPSHRRLHCFGMVIRFRVRLGIPVQLALTRASGSDTFDQVGNPFGDQIAK